MDEKKVEKLGSKGRAWAYAHTESLLTHPSAEVVPGRARNLEVWGFHVFGDLRCPNLV